MPHASRRTGIALMLMGMLIFALNDVMGKWLMGSYSAGQLMLIRSLSALAVLAPFLWQGGIDRLWRVERPGLQTLRGALLAVEGISFYAAVAFLPLADVVTYWLAAPIYVAALAPLVLNERVSLAAWGAIALGFVGVVVAMAPSGASLSPAAIIALTGSTAFTGAMLLGRKLRHTPDTVMVAWQILGAMIASALLTGVQSEGWRPTPLPDLAALCLLGIVSMVAHMLVNRSFKHAEAAVVMPFQYSLLIWAILFGVLFFDDWPRPAMLVGAGLIVVSGLLIARLRPG